jgi:putative MATE family efflux protein
MGGGIGAGASSAVARALGAGRPRDAAQLSAQALVLSVVIGLAFAAFVLVAAPAIFALLGGKDAILEQATLFARVLFGGAAITFLGGMFDSVLRGEGNVRIPAIWSSTSLILQMLVTPVLMFWFGWGLVGGALAMLACQLVAIGPRAWFVLSGRGSVKPVLRTDTLSPATEVLRVGVPAALSTSISNLGLMVLTGVVARLGAPDLAAYGLGTRLDFLLLSFAYGFGAAVLTLVGMAHGAKRPDLVRAFVLRAGGITCAILAVFGGVLCWKPSLWLGIFTDDPGIHAVGTTYFRIIGPSYAFLGVSMVLAFAFQGVGRATIPMMWMAARVAGVLASAIVCTRVLGLGERAVFTTIALGNVVSAAGMLVLFLRTERVLLAAHPAPVGVPAQASVTTSR